MSSLKHTVQLVTVRAGGSSTDRSFENTEGHVFRKRSTGCHNNKEISHDFFCSSCEGYSSRVRVNFSNYSPSIFIVHTHVLT